MRDTDREQKLLDTLILLKEESQRLIRRHREVMDDFDAVMYELDILKKKRQGRRIHEPFIQCDLSRMQKNAGGMEDIASSSSRQGDPRDKNPGRLEHD
jgi:hypothetical protein